MNKSGWIDLLDDQPIVDRAGSNRFDNSSIYEVLTVSLLVMSVVVLGESAFTTLRCILCNIRKKKKKN